MQRHSTAWISCAVTALVVLWMLAATAPMANAAGDKNRFFLRTASGMQKPPEPLCTWQTVERLPHDGGAFTQGLQWHDGSLYEGTGLYGESTLRKVDVKTGKVLRKIDLKRRYFGEGITILNDQVYQLTWREQTAFVYRLDDFSVLRTHTYTGEGWGLTHDNVSLIMSDGTAQIRFLDPATFKEQRRITVRSKLGNVTQLNELEYVNGAVYANIWQTSLMIRIDPASGEVLNWLDFSTLLPVRPAPGVLNGIALYDVHVDQNKTPASPASPADRLLVTGKNWPFMFHVTVNCPPRQ